MNVQIPNLPAATALSGSELLEVVQAGTSKKAEASLLFGAASAAAQASADAAAISASDAASSAADALISEGNAQASAVSAQADAAAANADAVSAQGDAASALASATAAQGSATSAAASANLATTILGTTNIYANTSAGISATTSGEYFAVPSPSNTEYVILYLNSGGSPVEIKTYPSTALLEPIKLITPIGYAWAIADQDGKVSLAVQDDGTTEVDRLLVDQRSDFAEGISIGGINEVSSSLAAYPWTVTDQDGKAAIGVATDGTFNAGAAQIGTLNGTSVATIVAAAAIVNAPASEGNFAAEINGLPIYGQSLSTGVSSYPPISTSQPYDNLSFFGGARPQDNPATPYASLIPLIETQITPAEAEAPGTYAGETPVSGATDAIKELILSENGISYTQQSYQLLGSAPGIGGASIASLSKPSFYYSRLLANVTNGYSLAQAAGKTYKCLAMGWLQGESDGSTAISSYSTALQQLQSDFESDVQSATGQSDPVILITYQTQGGNAAFGQRAAALAQPTKIYMAFPRYFLPASSWPHLTPAASKVAGAYIGMVYKRVIIDGAGWAPVQPISAYRQGAILTVRFNVPHKPLVFDTTTVDPQTNYGFSLDDGLGNPIAISSVSIVQPDTLQFNCAASIPAGAVLTYSSASGSGNLRDSAGSVLIFDGGGINYPMNNWCVLFTYAIA